MSCESADIMHRQYHLEWFSPALYLGFICLILRPLNVQKVQIFGEGEGDKHPWDPQDIVFLEARQKKQSLFDEKTLFSVKL